MISVARGLAPAIDTPAGTKKRKATEFNVAAHGLRGIAAMMVFAGHLLGGTAKHIYNTDPAYAQAVEGPWHFGTAGVVLFFVISGFVILPSVIRYSPGDFALRRFLRLYPLFFGLTLLFVALNAATNLYPSLNNAKAILAGLTFTNIFFGTEQLTPNAWSLTFEVIFYALTCAVVYFVVHRPNRVGLAVAGAASLAFLLYFPIASFFLGGAVVRLLYDRGFGLPKWPARLLELAALGLFIRYASMSWFAYVPADFANPIALMILASSVSYFALAVSPDSLTALCLKSSSALYLGTVSYSLYLVHPYTYYACRGLFNHFGLFTDNHLASMAFFYVVTTPITLAATHIVHKTLEMKPYEWVFHQRIYRTSSAEAPRAEARERTALRPVTDASSRPAEGRETGAQELPWDMAAAGPIVRLKASEVGSGSLGHHFRSGAAAVVIEGDPSVRLLWDRLMAQPSQLPWSSSLPELSVNLLPHDDLTEAVGDVFYFKPARHSYIARKIEISGANAEELTTRPSQFRGRDGDCGPEPDLVADCWRFSERILAAMGPAVSGRSDPASSFRAVVQQVKYQESSAAHEAVFGMMRNALGPWARIGYMIDRRREEMARPLARRGICDLFALFTLVPLIGTPIVQRLNARLARYDKRAVLPEGHSLLVKAHLDSRYFSALCGTRDNVSTEIYVDGRWLPLPINCDDIVVLPGAYARGAFGIKPTLHRVLQSELRPEESSDPLLRNVTLLLGAK